MRLHGAVKIEIVIAANGQYAKPRRSAGTRAGAGGTDRGEGLEI